MPEVSPSPTGPSPPGDSIILEEEIDPNYVPSQDEIDEYAKWLGMDLQQDKDLQWIAREGLKAPLPEHWKPCKTTDTDEIYYFNFSSGESTWDHPCDEYYRTLYEEQRKKKANDLKNSSSAKQKEKDDVRKLLDKKPKKAKKKKPPSLEKAPLGALKGTDKKSELAPIGKATSPEVSKKEPKRTGGDDADRPKRTGGDEADRPPSAPCGNQILLDGLEAHVDATQVAHAQQARGGRLRERLGRLRDDPQDGDQN